MNVIEIRAGSVDTNSLVLRVANLAVKLGDDGYNASTLEYEQAFVFSVLESKGVVYLANNGKYDVGFVLLEEMVRGRVVQLGLAYTVPEMRRKGIFEILTRRAIEDAKVHGFGKMVAHVAADGKSRKGLLKFGFEENKGKLTIGNEVPDLVLDLEKSR